MQPDPLPLAQRIEADHRRRSTEHVTLGLLARSLHDVQAILGPSHAGDLRVHPHGNGERTRITLRSDGRYEIVLHDPEAAARKVELPYILQDDIAFPLRRPADLHGRQTDAPDDGLRLTPNHAQFVQQLARPQQVTPSMLLSAAAIFLCGVVSIILSLFYDDLDAAARMVPAMLLVAATGAIGITLDILRTERRRRTSAQFQQVAVDAPAPRTLRLTHTDRHDTTPAAQHRHGA